MPLQERSDCWRGLRGLAGHIGIDPSIIRLVWIIVTLFSLGTGLIMYLAAWIIIPESPRESTQQTTVTDG